jgi:hypothetical protein
MITAALAVGAGLVIGLATGGRTANLGRHPMFGWPLLIVAFAAQSLAQVGGLQRIAYPLVLLSYVVLLVFAARNLHLVGMGVVLVGIALNAAVVLINHGMPVRPSAAAAAGIERLAAVHHTERESDTLLVLADVVPARAIGEVLSIGDLVLAVGLGNVVVRMTRPRAARSAGARRPRRLHGLNAVPSQ